MLSAVAIEHWRLQNVCKQNVKFEKLMSHDHKYTVAKHCVVSYGLNYRFKSCHAKSACSKLQVAILSL